MAILYFAFCSRVLMVAFTLSKAESYQNRMTQCGKSEILPCPIALGVKYLRITWYKMANGVPQFVLTENDGNTRSPETDVDGKFEMDANESLIIHRIQEEDAGMYRCSLRADVGQTNMDEDYNLTVPECPVLLPSTAGVTLQIDPHTTLPFNSSCCQGKSIPVHASVIGLLVLCLGKTLLSFTIPLVISIFLRYRMSIQTERTRFTRHEMRKKKRRCAFEPTLA